MAEAPARIEVLSIGNELLDGRVADTNTLRLAEGLAEIGLAVRQRATVNDDLDAIVAAAEACCDRGATLCVVCGGLGPTADDITDQAFARLTGVGLVRDAATVTGIEARFEKLGRPMTENQSRQADRPEGAELIPNPVGAAIGFALTHRGCRFVCVPGVPREFDAMIAQAVISPAAAGEPLARRELKSFGLIEGEVDRRLADLSTRWPGVRLGFRTHFPEIHVTLRAPTRDLEDLEAAEAFAVDQLGEALFSRSGQGFAEHLLGRLRSLGATLATAESCTGGLVGDMITDVPGSSDVFLGAVGAYHNETKKKLLGVLPATLDNHGAVSEQTVIEMARGACERVGSTFAVSVSGVAGPGGGTADKPVGTVWIAVAGPDLIRTRMLSLPFDRRRNKVISAYSALELLRRYLVENAVSEATA